MALDFGSFPGTWGIVCVIAVVVSSVACAVYVTIKIRQAREERRKRLRKPRNSLERYPSFIAGRINGVITFLPVKIDLTQPRRDAKGRRLSDQHSIAVEPMTFSQALNKKLDLGQIDDNNNDSGGLVMKPLPADISVHEVAETHEQGASARGP